MGPDAVILSPHFDDAVLSCWHVLTGAGEVLVVNVFAGEPAAGPLGWSGSARGRDRLRRDGPYACRGGPSGARARRPHRRQPAVLGQPVPPARPGAGRDRRGAARSGRGGRPDIRAGQPGRPPSRPHRRARGGTGAPGRGRSGGRCTPTCLTPPCSDGPGGCSTGSSSGADPAGERWARQLETTGIPVERMVAAAHRLPAEDHAGKLEAVLTYRSQIAPLQQVFGSSLEDPQLLGFEVDWRLPLMA